jgi:hypothetical protein
MNYLGPLTPKRLLGSERFRSAGQSLEFDVLEFWRWSASDLVSNATRGRLAEFITARALGAPTLGVRDEWAAYDLETPEGIKVEVKSSAYLQSWAQAKPSSVLFNVSKARAWDRESNRQAAVPTREAEVYVFALLGHQNKETLDPLDIDQWEFYVLPTRALNERKRSPHSITIKSLRALGAGPIAVEALPGQVRKAHHSGQHPPNKQL